MITLKNIKYLIFFKKKFKKTIFFNRVICENIILLILKY